MYIARGEKKEKKKRLVCEYVLTHFASCWHILCHLGFQLVECIKQTTDIWTASCDGQLFLFGKDGSVDESS
jgi:hypothetical protein